MKGYSFRLTGIRLAVLLFLLLGPVGLLTTPAFSEDPGLQARHLTERAQQTLETFAGAQEMETFRNLIVRARGVFIAPQVLKGAFIFGASGGSGIFVSRDSLRQEWAGPAFYTLGGASIGFQIGGNASEVILLALTDRGVNALLESSVKLGADIGLTMGPVGMGAAASTANLSADIISFSRSKGLYGGFSLDGTLVKTRRDLNEAYYRGTTTPADILIKRSIANPHARGLLEIVSKLAGGKPRGSEPPEPAAPPPSRPPASDDDKE